MDRYLVIAHQTICSSELLQQGLDIATRKPDASFAILVPATPIQHLLIWEEGETRRAAEKQAEVGRRWFERNGLAVIKAAIADASPLLAISDELQAHQHGYYTGIILSTFPPGISRWLRLDVHARARQQFRLPIYHVISSHIMETLMR